MDFKQTGALPGGSSTWRRNLCLFSIVAMVVALLWIPRLRGPIDLRWDAGVYYELGASLAAGKGYRIGSEPGDPVGVQYPPGLPALVAVYILVLGTDDPNVVGQALRWTYAGFFLAYGFAVLALARRYLPDAEATVATVITLLQGETLMASNLLFTEVPFALLGVLLVLLLEGRRASKRPCLRDAAAFLLAGCGFMLRSAGVVLLVAWPLSALLRREWKRFAVTLVVAAIPILGWQWHVKKVQHSPEYSTPAYSYQRAPYQFYNVPYAENLLFVDSFQPELGTLGPVSFFKRIASNVIDLPPVFGESVSTIDGFWYWAIERTQTKVLGKVYVEGSFNRVFLFVLGFTATGGVLILAWRGWPLQGLIVLGSAALVCITPWPDQFGRYLAPTTPFLAVGLVFAVRQSFKRISRHFASPGRMAKILTALLFTTLILIQVLGARKIFTSSIDILDGAEPNNSSLFYYDEAWWNWDEALDWITDHASEGDIVATVASHQCHLQTGLRAVFPPMEQDPIKAGRLMEAVPVKFVIVDELKYLETSRRYALPAIEAAPEKWPLAYQIGGTRVFESVSGKKPL